MKKDETDFSVFQGKFGPKWGVHVPSRKFGFSTVQFVRRISSINIYFS